MRVGIACLILLLCFGIASAKTIYVPDDYAKIQWAVDNASDGDIIIVRDGIYYENIDIDKSLTIKSENGSVNCIVQAAIRSDAVFEIYANNVTISGFDISNAIGVIGAAGIAIYGGDNCNISFNEIHDNYYGIYLADIENPPGSGKYDPSNHNIILENNIHNNLHSGILNYRMYEGDSYNTISANEIYYNDFSGIYFIRSNTNFVKTNLIHNNMNGIYFQNSINNYVYMNDFIDNAGSNIAGNSGNVLYTLDHKKIYIYNGRAYIGHLGNYYSDYTGTDSNGDGIGDTAYVVDSGDKDYYPLMLPFAYYLPPIVEISTNKYEYKNGDIMTLYLTFDNPNLNALNVNFTLRLEIHTYSNTTLSYTIVDNRTLTLLPSYKKTFTLTKALPPVHQPFKACWHAELYDSHSMILVSESIAEWKYEP